METVLLFAQFVATALVTGWLASGVRDNILFPSINETTTAQVMEMTRMREEYPEEFAQVAHRAITDRRLQRLAFRLVVAGEAIACLVLAVGTIALALALIGAVSPVAARSWALLGVALFTAVWGSFLVVGNHFSYWFSHEAAQNTHYQMTLWGVGTMILLAQG